MPFSTNSIACSSDWPHGTCKPEQTTCEPLNICRTCTNPEKGGGCFPVEQFPNATVSEYGVYHHQVGAIMAEVLLRGPVAASVNAGPLKVYTGGVMLESTVTKNMTHTHRKHAESFKSFVLYVLFLTALLYLDCNRGQHRWMGVLHHE